ncbi:MULTISPECIES: AIM24 family protein [Streptomyces diastaticus group]|nr:AIM24 family protein [Streptomyces gougerotii]
MLVARLTGDTVRAKNGSMVAYDGRMTFKRLMGGGNGLRGMVTRRLTGEQMEVMEVRGEGTVWFADSARDVSLVHLSGETLHVEADNLLCTDGGLRTGTSFTGLGGAAQGNGLFTTTVEGTGQAAVMSAGPVVALRVSGAYPLTVDPGAYIAHQGGVRRSLQSGAGARTLFGEGGGEAFQLRFEGEGVVYVQPSERATFGGDL